MTTLPPLPPSVRRILLAHGLGATALGLPWPGLLVAVWDHNHSNVWLGLTGAARMAPYVLLSWLAGRVADRLSRGRLVRASLAARVVALVATASLLAGGHVSAAVACACLTVALGTPAYPAIAAEMPVLAGAANEQATSLVVTLEVGAFVVGPAAGGLLLGTGGLSVGCWVAAGSTLTALLVVRGVVWAGPPRQPSRPGVVGDTRPRSVVWSLRCSPDAVKAIVGVTATNAIGSAVAIALLPLAEQAWRADRAAFGVATAAVGVGAFAAPLMQRHWGLGPSAWRRAALAVALPLVVVAVASGLWLAVVPLTVMGAASVHLEAVATKVIQSSVPNDVRSSVLGLTDSVMVAAAAGAALAAPLMSGLVGPRGLIALAAAGALALLAVATGALAADAAGSAADGELMATLPGLTQG